MKRRSGAAAAGLLVSTLAAQAADMPALPLPILAQEAPPAVSPWQGFYVGTEIFGIAGKGVKGGLGGDVLAGYDHAFANNIVLGIEGAAGFAPAVWPNSAIKGYEFSATNVKLGYDMGRWLPYVTAGLVIAKANSGPAPSLGIADSASDLLSDPGRLYAAPRVGAGVDYALTNNLQVGLAVSVGRSPAPLWP